MLLFFVTGTLGYSDLEVTIFKDLLSLKHAALQKKLFPMWSRRDFPKHLLRDVIIKIAGDKIHSDVLNPCKIIIKNFIMAKKTNAVSSNQSWTINSIIYDYVCDLICFLNGYHISK